MKASDNRKFMTLGEFIVRAFDDCGERKGRQLIRFAFESHLVELRRQPAREPGGK